MRPGRRAPANPDIVARVTALEKLVARTDEACDLYSGEIPELSDRIDQLATLVAKAVVDLGDAANQDRLGIEAWCDKIETQMVSVMSNRAKRCYGEATHGNPEIFIDDDSATASV